jgi:hypothetical protein
MSSLKEAIRSLKTRKSRSGNTRVTVVEMRGELVAIVADKYRGEVRIPLGMVDPSIHRFP